MQVIISIIALSAAVLGYWIASKVPEELRIGKPWFLGAGAVAALALFLVLPWWQATISVGTMLVGWIPSIVGIAWASTDPGVASAQITILLALLSGSRWKAEGWQLKYLIWSVCLCGALLVILDVVA